MKYCKWNVGNTDVFQQRKAIRLINVPATADTVGIVYSLSLTHTHTHNTHTLARVTRAENYLSRSTSGEDYAKWRVIGARRTETSF